MVRFGLGSLQSPPPYTGMMGGTSPSPTSYGSRGGEFTASGPPKDGETPLQLACTSEDGRSVHVLVQDNAGSGFAIHTWALPLQGTTDQEWEPDMPRVIHTALPDGVSSMLSVETPLELICVEGDAGPDKSVDGPNRLLSILCVYTRHAAFLLQLGYPDSFRPYDGTPVDGVCLSVQEPFQSFLLSESSGRSIVRIRPAPHQRLGYVLCSPQGSMAMLTQDAVDNSYSLVLYHGVTGYNERLPLTVAIAFGMESLGDGGADRITDFNFGQSNELSLLASISVHFLKGSGEVWGASPVLCEGAVVPQVFFQQCWEYMNAEADGELGPDGIPPNPAKQRQYRGACAYLHAAFSTDLATDSDFLTSVLFTGDKESPTYWPVQLQGPIVRPNNETPGVRAAALEPFFAQNLVGIAIGYTDPAIDFAVIPPSALVPRFQFEDGTDGAVIDTRLTQFGVVVESVELSMPADDETVADTRPDRQRTILVRDPVKENLIHILTKNCVISVQGSGPGAFSRKIRGVNDSGNTVETRAWVSFVSTNPGSLIGAVVSADARLGHALIACRKDGKCVCSLSCLCRRNDQTGDAANCVKRVSCGPGSAERRVMYLNQHRSLVHEDTHICTHSNHLL